MKKILSILGFGFFCECHHKWSNFRPFWPILSATMPKLLDGSTVNLGKSRSSTKPDKIGGMNDF